MNPSEHEKRIANLELAKLLRDSSRSKFKDLSSRELVEELLEGTFQVRELALRAGEYRVALATIDSLLAILQLRTKLDGELKDAKPANVFDLDDERASEIARMFLQRERRITGGGQ